MYKLKLTKSRAKLKKIEVCWSIKGQNAQIQNQGLKLKRLSILGLTIEFGKGKIV